MAPPTLGRHTGIAKQRATRLQRGVPEEARGLHRHRAAQLRRPLVAYVDQQAERVVRRVDARAVDRYARVRAGARRRDAPDEVGWARQVDVQLRRAVAVVDMPHVLEHEREWRVVLSAVVVRAEPTAPPVAAAAWNQLEPAPAPPAVVVVLFSRHTERDERRRGRRAGGVRARVDVVPPLLHLCVDCDIRRHLGAVLVRHAHRRAEADGRRAPARVRRRRRRRAGRVARERA